MAKADSSARPRTVTGIDYGKRVIRLATITAGRSGKVTIRGLSQALVQHGRKGVAEDLQAGQRNALKEALAKHPKDLGDIIVGIPREEVISRLVSLPSGDPAEVREMLFFDVERFLPFPPDEAEVSYRVLEQIGANESHVLMVGARRKDLYRILEDLDTAGVEPSRLDVEAHGCGYAFARVNGEAGEGTFAIVHLDLQNSLVALVKDRQLRYSRSTPVGIEELESASLGTTFESDPAEWPETQSQWWANAVRNIRRTLAGFAHEPFGTLPKHIVLSGPGSEIPGLRTVLEKEMAVPVASPLPIPAGKMSEPILFYSTAIGLALEEIEGDHHINLVPEEIYTKREAARRKQFLVNAATLLVINLILAGTWIGHAFWHKQQVVDIFQSKILEYRPKTKDIDEIQAKLDVIGKNIDSKNSAFKVVRDLFERTPDRVKMKQLTFTKSDSLNLNLETFTPGDLDDYVRILTDSPYFIGTVERGQSKTEDLTRGGKLFDVPSMQKVTGVKATIRSNQKLKE
jgi:type IV pilus assembly protein PilM